MSQRTCEIVALSILCIYNVTFGVLSMMGYLRFLKWWGLLAMVGPTLLSIIYPYLIQAVRKCQDFGYWRHRVTSVAGCVCFSILYLRWVYILFDQPNYILLCLGVAVFAFMIAIVAMYIVDVIFLAFWKWTHPTHKSRYSPFYSTTHPDQLGTPETV